MTTRYSHYDTPSTRALGSSDPLDVVSPNRPDRSLPSPVPDVTLQTPTRHSSPILATIDHSQHGLMTLKPLASMALDYIMLRERTGEHHTRPPEYIRRRPTSK